MSQKDKSILFIFKWKPSSQFLPQIYFKTLLKIKDNKSSKYFRNQSEISLTIYNDKKSERIYDKHDLKNYPGNIFNCDESRFQPF